MAATLWSVSVQAATPLTIVGSEKIVWAFRALPADADGAQRLQFAYAVADPKGVRFHRLPIAPSNGEIVRAAVCSDQLYVFFADGTHYRFRPPLRSTATDRMQKNDFPEVNLPDNQVPAALTGDAKARTLYAVVPLETARRLIPETIEDATTNAETSPTREAEALLADASSNGLVRYASNSWKIVCGIPAFFDGGRVCGLTADENLVHLLFDQTALGGQLRYTVWSPVRSAWSPPTVVPGVRADDLLDVVLIEQKPALLVRVAAADADTFNLRAITLLDGAWRAQAVLTIDGQPFAFEGASASAHRFRDQIAVAFSQVGADGVKEDEAKETVRIGLWPAEGGDPTTAPAEVVALMRGPDDVETEQQRTLAATVALALTLMVVVMRRRESFLVDAVLPNGRRLARLGRRFAAVLVDLVIVTVLVSPILVAPWLKAKGIALTDDVQAEVQWVIAQEPDAVFWLWVKVAVAFVLYGVAFETTVAATPGKLLLGLRVFDEKGHRASFVAILLRNAFRLELYYPGFQFAPIGILVVLTRNRQRLGDLLARTVVVERSPETRKSQA